MDAARRVLSRLAQIEALERADAPPIDLLSALASLAEEAEDWAAAEGGEEARAAVARLRAALTRDMIAM